MPRLRLRLLDLGRSGPSLLSPVFCLRLPCCLLCSSSCAFLLFCLCFFSLVPPLLLHRVLSRGFRLARGGVSFSLLCLVHVCLSLVCCHVCALSRLGLAFIPCLAFQASACLSLLPSRRPMLLPSSLFGVVLVVVVVLKFPRGR